jgi:hypothetical protein
VTWNPYRGQPPPSAESVACEVTSPRFIILGLDLKKQDLEAAENALPGAKLEKSSLTRWSTYFFRLFFVFMALPIVIVALGAIAGKIPVDNVNWLQWFVNTATFAMLAVIWVEIKKINRQVGRELRRESNRMTAESVSANPFNRF